MGKSRILQGWRLFEALKTPHSRDAVLHNWCWQWMYNRHTSTPFSCTILRNRIELIVFSRLALNLSFMTSSKMLLPSSTSLSSSVLSTHELLMIQISDNCNYQYCWLRSPPLPRCPVYCQCFWQRRVLLLSGRISPCWEFLTICSPAQLSIYGELGWEKWFIINSNMMKWIKWY